MPRPQFILFIEPARADMPLGPTEQEALAVGAHFQYLKDQLAAGTVILVGRTQAPPFMGIAIFEADDIESANQFVRADPAIDQGVFRVSGLHPYQVALMRNPDADGSG